MSSTANILHLLRLLEEDSDENHILTMPQILSKLKANGASPSIDRRTVYALIDTLCAFDYDISTHADNKKGYFLRTRAFEDCEIRFLMDSVVTSKSIPLHQRKGLIKKLARFGSKNFKCAFADIALLSENFVQNPDLFLNIELVEEAISSHRQLTLASCNYGPDKKLHPNYGSKLFLVNPYKMVVQNQKYYLICNYDNREGITHLRLDRMMHVSIVENSKAKQLSLDLSSYITEHPYMYAGSSQVATLQIEKDILGDVLDTFGKDVSLASKEGQMLQVTLKANHDALCYWALQYGTKCEVLAPDSLRADVAEMVKGIAEKYSKKAEERIT